jgi:hypothetical protein
MCARAELAALWITMVASAGQHRILLLGPQLQIDGAYDQILRYHTYFAAAAAAAQAWHLYYSPSAAAAQLQE